jgi:CO/xanthine dehydrogenase Mo-binding subunit
MIASAIPQSLAENPLLSQWIAFEGEDRVRIATGKVEIGQGILTALTQIAAEELDVAPARVRIVSGETDASPAEGFTSGSYSVAVGGAAIRLVCAEVRELFLEYLAERLGCRTRELSIEDGKFLLEGEETGRDYWSMVGRIDLQRRSSGSAPTKPPSAYRVVGTNLPRLDLPAKVCGAAFIHDLAPENVAHARVLRQPWRGARLAALDENAVRKAAKTPIEILREGDFVAFTAASEIAVMRAAEAARARARWEGGEPAPEGIGEPAWLKAQPSRDRTVQSGPPGIQSEGRVIEARYSRPFLTYGSIGPSCALAELKDGALKIWSHCQGPAVQRDWIARALGLKAAQVTVFHRQGAGAYGHNTADDAAFDAAFIATRMPGHTVRAQWSREDEFSSAPISPATIIELRAMLGPDQRPADWSIEIWSPPHARRPGMNSNLNLLGAEALPDAAPLNEPADVPDERGGGATRNAYAIYDLPRHRLIHHLLPRVPLRTSSLRGLGAWGNVFAIESFIDELAQAAGEDPVSYRLSLLSDTRARRVVETAAQMSGWFESRGAGEGREVKGGCALGFGFARYKNIASYAAVVAKVEVEEEVRLKRVWCAVDAGLVISPDGAKNQIEGGIIQGASFVLKERVRFEGGKVATATWEDYPILRFSEAPEIDIRLIEAPNEPALGLGEASVGPTGAAIGNAVARALGQRIRDLPLTRERIMAVLLQP